jgi:DNA processing protein
LKPTDVLEILEWVRVVQYPEKKRAVPDPGLEHQLYENILNEAAHVDELSVLLNLPVDKIAAALTIMEIKGLVRQVEGLKYLSV